MSIIIHKMRGPGGSSPSTKISQLVIKSLSKNGLSSPVLRSPLSKKMKQGLLLRSSPCSQFPILPFPVPRRTKPTSIISATLDSSVNGGQLTARERRQLRNERRETKAATTGTNWREEVEEKLLKKPKKRYASWTEELNLDNLALLGPQWWVLRVSRVSGQITAERLARLLAKNYPEIEFKVYAPAVQVKRKLKNGSISVKPKPLFPGCVFLRCVLNKEMHDFIRECEGIGGFIGSKVGNTKRQINRPKPVSVNDIEAMFRQAKEEQEKVDQAFEEEQQGEETPDPLMLKIGSYSGSKDVTESVMVPKPKKRSSKTSDPIAQLPSTGKDAKLLRPGSMVQVVSGTFAEFSGTLKKLDRKTTKATVAFTLFGKETLVDLDVNEIAVETK